MNPLDALLAPYGANLTISEAADVLGWSAGDTTELIEVTPALLSDSGAGVSATALRDFLLQHRVVVRAEPFRPSRRPGLLPVRQIVLPDHSL